MNTNTQAIKDRLKAINGVKVESSTTEIKKEDNPIVSKVEFMDEVPQPTKMQFNDPIELLKQLGNYMQPQAAEMDENRVKELINESLKGVKPTKLEVHFNGKVNNIDGLIHYQFEDIFKAVSAKLHIWLTGSAGSGKTHISEQVAQSLGLPFYCVSVCSQTTESKLLGYNDANGNYSSTVFYEAYKNGGIFLLDEIDNGNANVLSVLNSALANGVCAFPCGMTKKHEDFICIAAANTIGSGGNIQYVGRNRIDAATLDRFIMIHFEIDKKLEIAISGNENFTLQVQKLRDKANVKGLNCVISPRASINGAKLLNVGFDMETVLDMVIFNKLSESEIKTLKA